MHMTTEWDDRNLIGSYMYVAKYTDTITLYNLSLRRKPTNHLYSLYSSQNT